MIRRLMERLISSADRVAKWAGVLGLLMAINGYAAEAVNETVPVGSEAVDQNPVQPELALETDTDAEIATDPTPTEILGGTGLKNRKLSEVFEQFVPSESISADNAVPFPVDI
ncbi:MAG: hypothetical protein ACI82A_000025 [Candidatus Azotimanducaceae bacterium]